MKKKKKKSKRLKLVAFRFGFKISKYTWEIWTTGYFQALQMTDNVILCVCTGFSGSFDKFTAFVL